MRRFEIKIDESDMGKYYNHLCKLPIYFIDNKTGQENGIELRDLIPSWLISKIENYDFKNRLQIAYDFI